MSINILPSPKPQRKTFLPRDFCHGKVYQAIDNPAIVVMGTRETRLEAGAGYLMGVGLDNTSTPWFKTDDGRSFYEVDITVTVEQA